MTTQAASWSQMFHSRNPLHVYWSRQPSVFLHLTLLLYQMPILTTIFIIGFMNLWYSTHYDNNDRGIMLHQHSQKFPTYLLSTLGYMIQISCVSEQHGHRISIIHYTVTNVFHLVNLERVPYFLFSPLTSQVPILLLSLLFLYQKGLWKLLLFCFNGTSCRENCNLVEVHSCIVVMLKTYTSTFMENLFVSRILSLLIRQHNLTHWPLGVLNAILKI